jgi:penicillin amidase
VRGKGIAVVAWIAVGLAGSVAAAESQQAIEVQGLQQPAEILIDRWGVPHIYAGDHYDAFFVQGYNAARDRLWQIDLWRRRGLGRLSEVFGKAYAEQDRASRLFLYRGDMYREWLAYGSDAKRIAEAFVAGINAFVERTERDSSLLPPEFGLLGYRPARWQASDVVRIRGHGLWRNVTSEVTRARVTCRFGPEADTLRRRLTPDWRPEVPKGLDPCSIPAGVLRDYELATSGVRFGPPDAAGALQDSEASVHGVGSNNWAVSPARTATGRPILADDPHRGHAVPSLRYIAHLVAPGLDVIGAGEPSLPGISIGHNQRIAFGLTIFGLDQEDLYVYETDPKDPERYRYRGEWVPFETVRETIEIEGALDRDVTLEFTRHGPVVFEDPEAHRAFAVRAGWLEPGMAPYFGSIEYMRAQNWREFVAALNRWGAPAENQVYADVDGNIGYKPAGLFPRRVNFDGLLPVPGDGRFEWQGYFDMDALPEEYNPTRGFVATANAMNLPPDYPIKERRVGFEWAQPWRYQRIFEVLQSQERHRIEDSLQLQRDYTSVLAREILETLPEKLGDPAADRALSLLAGWDAVLLPDSAPAALYSVWVFRYLLPGLVRTLAPEDAAPLLEYADPLQALAYLKTPSAERDALLVQTLSRALETTESYLGPDPTEWQWGAMHPIALAHPLADYAQGDLKDRMTLPRYPRGGSPFSPNNGWFSAANFNVLGGASWRMVLDVGRWDAALATSAPGQSGDPRSPFFGNLLENWATDDAFPLLYTREAVEEHTVERIVLRPAP